jgi:hypothetical protein
MALQFVGHGNQIPLLQSLGIHVSPAAATAPYFSGFQTSIKTSLPSATSVPNVENLGLSLDCATSAPAASTPANTSSILSEFLSIISLVYETLGFQKVLSALLASYWNHNKSTASKIDYNTISASRTARNYTISANSTLNFNGDEENLLRHIPDYVLEYAPYCHLYSEEEYWPGLMSEHLEHTVPFINYDPVPDEYQRPDLHNLDQLNQFEHMYLTSKDDPESYPDWIGGVPNIPKIQRLQRPKRQKSTNGTIQEGPEPHRSSAPAILLVVDKGEYVDAFWFFFYSFNLGNQVFGKRFGNHVGDWEHTTIRFKDGIPIQVFYSEHSWGAAYRWEDAEKLPSNEKRVRKLLALFFFLKTIMTHMK